MSAGTLETVEELVRYAAAQFAAAGIEYRPSRMSKLIRRTSRIDVARAAIDGYLSDQITDRSWTGFELFVNGYADPTGANAARNLDLADAAAQIRAAHVLGGVVLNHGR